MQSIEKQISVVQQSEEKVIFETIRMKRERFPSLNNALQSKQSHRRREMLRPVTTVGMGAIMVAGALYSITDGIERSNSQEVLEGIKTLLLAGYPFMVSYNAYERRKQTRVQITKLQQTT